MFQPTESPSEGRTTEYLEHCPPPATLKTCNSPLATLQCRYRGSGPQKGRAQPLSWTTSSLSHRSSLHWEDWVPKLYAGLDCSNDNKIHMHTHGEWGEREKLCVLLLEILHRLENFGNNTYLHPNKLNFLNKLVIRTTRALNLTHRFPALLWRLWFSQSEEFGFRFVLTI